LKSHIERTNRKEKVVERIIKYWQRLWEMDKRNIKAMDALKQKSTEKGNNYLRKIEQEPNGLGVGGT
jgi:hypothetical protein